MTLKKTLRDSIKELEDPGLSVNFADSDDDLTFAKVAEGGEEEEEGDHQSNVKEFGNLRKKASLITEDSGDWGKKYSGSKISRKNLKKWDESGGKSILSLIEEIIENHSNFLSLPLG